MKKSSLKLDEVYNPCLVWFQFNQRSVLFEDPMFSYSQSYFTESFFLSLFRNPYYVDCSLAYIVAYNLGNRATTT